MIHLENKFLLFSGSIYYPYGGWKDFQGAFDTPKEAIDLFSQEELSPCYMWAHIVWKGKIYLEADIDHQKETVTWKVV